MNESTVLNDALERFLYRIDADQASELLADVNPEEPEVALTGALELDREQETDMVEYALNRMESIMDEQGRSQCVDVGQNTASRADLDSFLSRRRLFELLYHKRIDWRKGGWGALFGKSNLHVPMVRRIVQQQIARANQYFFATEPWFDAGPQGEGMRDAEVAKRVNRYSQWKFRKGRIRATFEKAVENAMIRGEGVVKCTPKRRVRHYEDILPVAVEGPGGEILLATDGDVIQKDDVWIPVTNPETGEPMMDEETEMPVMVLQRAPDTVKPAEELIFEVRKVLRERIIYNGPEAKNVYYLDFVCPEEAESIQEAELVAHLYDMPAVELATQYIEMNGDKKERVRLLELLRNASGPANSEAPAAKGARVVDGDNGNERLDSANRAGHISVAEIYLRMDVNGDGREEEIMLLVDRETRKPIFYDYLDRVTPKGARPFACVRVNPVDGRWYGNSQVDLFWDLQMFIDLTMNRWNFSQMESGRVDCVDPSAVYEGDGESNFHLNTGRKYRLKEGKKIEDFFQTMSLFDVKGAELQSQLEFFMQIANNMGGTMSANDAQMVGLDSAKLATGIRNIEKGGQELFAPLLSHLEEGLSDGSSQLIHVLGETMDEEEVLEFFEAGEGDPEESAAVKTTITVMRSDITAYDWVVEMQLTRYKNEQELQQALHALDMVDRFYASPPDVQEPTRPLYLNMLKLFNVPNADRVLQPGISTFMPPGGGPDPQEAAASVAPMPDGQSEPNL